MAGGRSSPALFELIKPGPTPNHAAGPVAPPTKPPSRLTESPSKPVVQVPAKAADAPKAEVFQPPVKLPKVEVPPPPPSAAPELPEPPPSVQDPERQAARIATMPEGGRERWFAMVSEEFRRLFGDRAGKVAIALAAMFFLSAVVFGIGYQIGTKREREKTNSQIGKVLDLQDRPKEPGLALPKATNPNLIRPDGPPRSPANSVEQPRTSTGRQPTGSGNPGTPVGPTHASRTETQSAPSPPAPGPGGDLREPGKNYLHIASRLDEATASKMAKFLGENGLPVMVIGVDKNERASNNPAFYIVVSAKGLASSEFNPATKSPLEDKVDSLGKRWKSEQKGWSDLSDRWWRKHVP